MVDDCRGTTQPQPPLRLPAWCALLILAWLGLIRNRPRQMSAAHTASEAKNAIRPRMYPPKARKMPLIPGSSALYRVGAACGGALLDPAAVAGLPGMKRLQPLLPETRSRNGCSFSSMHSPIVVFLGVAFGSICHHLQSLHRPHDCFFATILLPLDKFGRRIGAP